MTTTLILVALLAAIGFAVWRWIGSLDGGQKVALKNRLNDVIWNAERSGRYPPLPAFELDYHDDYPELEALERHHADVQAECLELLQIKQHITDTEALGGGYTQGGIHSAAWKTYVFKQGRFIDENCRRAPKTTALLKRIPGCYTAFFSILEPGQVITPHFGYWKGFVRYHLGVLIPNDNDDRKCWLRVNPDPEAARVRDRSPIEKGEVYHWRNGQGVLFDDTFLHDAANESDEVRVVLWLDLRRKLPLWLDLYNRICLWVAHQDASVRRIREIARVRT